MTIGSIILSIFGFLGSLITIYELINKFIHDIKKSNKKLILIIRVIIGTANLVLIATIMGLYIYQYTINLELRNIEKQATAIIADNSDLSTIGKKKGYINECFVFLEKYKDRFPEAYKNANNYIQMVESEISDNSEKIKDYELGQACDTMQGFIKGIAILK